MQQTKKTRICRELSIVIPSYNEEEVLPMLWERIKTALADASFKWRVVFVDDGSTDGSPAFLLSLADREDARVSVMCLSRNFGHQTAITAGLAVSRGDATVVMDADLQDPPEVIAEMVREYEDGCDVVYAQRRTREGETVFKRATAALFYRMLRVFAGRDFPRDAGDFRLMSSDVVNAVNAMPETHRYVRGMVAWVGFRQKGIMFDRAERAAGKTKYGVTGMIRFAWSALASFSAFPVRLGMPLGAILLSLSVLYSIRVLYVKFALGTAVPGWTTIVLLQLAFFGLMFFYLGVIGDYVGRIYEEGKRRPLYIVKLRKNLETGN